HPNNHVNLSQSTNDVYPTALKIALIWMLRDLEAALAALRDAFLLKADEFADIVKIGRTQLQDAVPMTLGQEFRAFGITLGEDIERLREAAGLFCEINLGATAIGTGINTDPRYAALVRDRLAEITGLPLVTSPDLVEATADTGVFVQLSRVLKRVATKLSKIRNDQRPPRRPRRDLVAAHAAGLEHHAGQGEPGHPRGRHPGLPPGGRQRPHGDDRGRGGPAPAQRVRAGHRLQPLPVHRHARAGVHRAA